MKLFLPVPVYKIKYKMGQKVRRSNVYIGLYKTVSFVWHTMYACVILLLLVYFKWVQIRI